MNNTIMKDISARICSSLSPAPTSTASPTSPASPASPLAAGVHGRRSTERARVQRAPARKALSDSLPRGTQRLPRRDRLGADAGNSGGGDQQPGRAAVPLPPGAPPPPATRRGALPAHGAGAGGCSGATARHEVGAELPCKQPAQPKEYAVANEQQAGSARRPVGEACHRSPSSSSLGHILQASRFLEHTRMEDEGVEPIGRTGKSAVSALDVLSAASAAASCARGACRGHDTASELGAAEEDCCGQVHARGGAGAGAGNGNGAGAGIGGPCSCERKRRRGAGGDAAPAKRAKPAEQECAPSAAVALASR